MTNNPMKFGGLGGIAGGRGINHVDRFEDAVARQLGEQMKTDDVLCTEVWCALANVDWRHENGDEASYSFRAAGDLVAAIRGSGDYMDWYCSGPSGDVSDTVADAMAKEGWTWEAL